MPRQRIRSISFAWRRSAWRKRRCEIRIATADGRDLPNGEVGEVLVRGDTVMRGYWGNAEATAAALREGWLYTGDVGSVDDAGFLTLKDRSKDLIISGGSNIYPREVEEVLLTAPGVAEVAVVGAPDPEWGEVVVAFVVAQRGARVVDADLDSHCLTRIARFKRPKRYVLDRRAAEESLRQGAQDRIARTAARGVGCRAGGWVPDRYLSCTFGSRFVRTPRGSAEARAPRLDCARQRRGSPGPTRHLEPALRAYGGPMASAVSEADMRPTRDPLRHCRARV